MSVQSSTHPKHSAAEIQDWIVSRLSVELKVAPETIDVRQPFTSFGVDSIAIFTLTGDLAEWLERDLRATLLWEFPNIAELSAHLAEPV
jgi:acyl carrier protein